MHKHCDFCDFQVFRPNQCTGIVISVILRFSRLGLRIFSHNRDRPLRKLTFRINLTLVLFCHLCCSHFSRSARFFVLSPLLFLSLSAKSFCCSQKRPHKPRFTDFFTGCETRPTSKAQNFWFHDVCVAEPAFKAQVLNISRQFRKCPEMCCDCIVIVLWLHGGWWNDVDGDRNNLSDTCHVRPPT